MGRRSSGQSGRRGDARSEPTGARPGHTDVEAALAHVLASPSFAKSPRMTGFLRYVVDQTMAGRQEYLKEYTIALEVFGRDATFDPQTSPIVRVQASKLRRLLALYYTTEGKDEPVRIDLPRGGYAAHWSWREEGEALEDDTNESPRSKAEVPTRVAPERRQITVLHCELAGAGTVSTLDTEDAFELTREYRAWATDIVQKYAGSVARYSDDGLTAYFGYPQAHENDAEGAVRAGLALVNEIGSLRSRTPTPLSLQVGISTGNVVAGDMSGDGAGDAGAVVGDPPRLATLLRATAEPNHVIVGSSTRHLIGDTFACTVTGSHDFEGFSHPVEAWRVDGLSAFDNRFEAAHANALSPIQGRKQEIALLLDRWQQAKEGEGQVVVLSGEAGIGKSRIARALAEDLKDEEHFALRYQCLPYFANSMLYPVSAQIERAARLNPNDDENTRLDKLEALLRDSRRPIEEALPPVAQLLSIPLAGRYPAPIGSLERQRERLLEVLHEQILSLAFVRPVLATLEDLHWADPTTLELLQMTIESLHDVPLLLLVTHRPEFHPEWGGFAHVTQLSLNRLRRNHCASLVRSVAAGKSLPDQVTDQILSKTDGVPLYVEEFTKAVITSGFLEESGDRYTLKEALPSSVVPDTLQDSLMARLDRIATVKEVAQIAAAIGREFGQEFLRIVSERPEEELEEALGQLSSAGLIFRYRNTSEPRFAFKHALVQDAAYQSLLKSRRAELHARIADVIRAEYPDRAEMEPELLGHHASAAGLHAVASDQWQKAGQLATSRSAYTEASHHFSRALESLEAIAPNRDTIQRKLACLLALAAVETARKGYAATEVADIYRDARHVCEQAEMEEITWALYGIAVYHFVRGEFHLGQDVAERAYQAAERSGDPAQLTGAHLLIGDYALVTASDPDMGRRHFEAAITAYREADMAALIQLTGDNPAVIAAMWLSVIAFFKGDISESDARLNQVDRLREESGHTHTFALSVMGRALILSMRGEHADALTAADEAIALSSEHGFPDLLGWATTVRGRALCDIGEVEEGVAQASNGIAIMEAVGAEALSTWSYSAVAESFMCMGDNEGALGALEQAFVTLEKSGERLWESELHRIKGDVLAGSNADFSIVESSYEEAIAVASRNRLDGLELRAVIGFAGLWEKRRNKQKRAVAISRLAESLRNLSENQSSHDVQIARQLHDRLVAKR
ncbi:MAG: AAA family ATPase [Pseudomonadota bacterium]